MYGKPNDREKSVASAFDEYLERLQKEADLINETRNVAKNAGFFFGFVAGSTTAFFVLLVTV